ncbi:MAG: FAD-dependent oxidoreductase [Bdellovibrionota bacterium]
METHSLWQETDVPFLPALSSHAVVDVCVVGGGITGLTTAYRLLESGRSVVVLERGTLPAGETTFSTGHLTSVLDDRYFQLRQMHGLKAAQLAAESHACGISELERISATEGIDCNFTRTNGFLFLAPGEEEQLLARELSACHESGLLGVEFVSDAGSPLFSTGPVLRIPGQARFHPGRYVAGLARAIQRLGGKVYTHTEALDAKGGHPARVLTNRGFQVVCESIVVATNVPFNDRFALQAKMAPYRSYVVGLELDASRMDLSLFWDTAEPYHYVRTAFGESGEPLLLVGGEDHRTGQDHGIDHFARLRAWARERLLVDGDARFQWSGQILEPHDGLAFIGLNPGDHDNVYIAGGFSGNGLTYGAIAADVLTDLINGQINPWASLYSPGRITLRSLGTFLRENVAAATPYSDWVTTGDVGSVEEIPRESGAVLREGMQKIAVYKDNRGCPHFFSAVCPHMNGIVRWNESEKTWDCPCHGSRFDRMGRLLNGPASTGLRAIEGASIAEGDAVSA